MIETTTGAGVLTIALRRPEKKNALTAAMYEDMIAAFARAESDDSIGAILLRGCDGVFTAGNDIVDFIAAARNPAEMAAWRFVQALAHVGKPLVAAIEGAAVGIGATLTLHCDLVYAAPDARFSMPFVDLGLVPEAGASLLLPRRIGMARASEILLLARGYDAQQAQAYGLVNAIVAREQLYDHAHEQAAALARKPRAALAAARRLMRGDPAELDAQMQREAKAFSQALQSGEAQKAFAAFLERSKA